MTKKRISRTPLTVYLNDKPVGEITTESSGAIKFQYIKDWLEFRYSAPISLALPLKQEPFTGNKVLNLLDNLLPDNLDIRRHLAERTDANGYDPYSLIETIGHDCVGALQFLKVQKNSPPPAKLVGKKISSKAIENLVVNLKNSPLGLGNDDEFRISIAGAQEKTALLFWQNQWLIPHGTTPTTHIIKPEIKDLFHSVKPTYTVENEYFCMRLAQAVGLPAANTEMITFGKTRTLVIERFDRAWVNQNRLLRLPQEDCCQALDVPSAKKYEMDGGPGIKEILKLLQSSDKRSEDIKTFIKAQIFFWLIGATDGHAKNFSIFLLPGGRFHLTPLYDIMSAQPYVDAGLIRKNKMKLAMAVGDKNYYQINNILPRHFLQTITKNGLGEKLGNEIFEELKHSLPTALEKTKSSCKGFSSHISNSIEQGILKRLSLL